MPKKLFVILIILSLLLSGNAIIKNAKGNSKRNTKDIMWGQFQHDARHTGRSNADMSNNTGDIIWKLKFSDEGDQYNPIFTNPPIIDKNGDIYIMERNMIYVIDSTSGIIKGKINLDDLDGNRIFEEVYAEVREIVLGKNTLLMM